MSLDEKAVKIAVKLIAKFEGCNLTSYPDPSSPLYSALSQNGMLTSYMRGTLKWQDLPVNFKQLDGSPFTVGYGSTYGVTKHTVWTQKQATDVLEATVREFMTRAIQDCPPLAKLSPERVAAITSLCYNIGSKAFRDSTACREIKAGNYGLVANAIKMWNKAGGRVMQGLINRRLEEANLWNSK
jgi:lysozyme